MKKFIGMAIVLIFSCSLTLAQPTQWSSRGLGGGGALFAPSFSPHNGNELYMACDMSELFHSASFGATWEMVPFTKIQASSGARVQFTSDPKILYCIDYAHDQATPVKSADGGETWQPLASDPTNGEAWSLLVEGSGTQRLLLTDYTRLYFSNNGGTSFTLKYTAMTSNGCHIAGAFFDAANIFVGTNEGLLISTNNGNSFALANVSGIPNGQAMLSFSGAKQGSATRLFALTADAANVYPGVPGSDYWNMMQGVYALDYGAANWTARMNGIQAGQDFPFFIATAWNDINTVYIAGGSANGDPIVMKSTNAGVSWSHVFRTSNNQNIATGWSGFGGDRSWGYGECALGFAVAPNDVNKLALTDYGFMHLSNDGGATWSQKYVAASDQNAAGSATPKGKSYHSIGVENTSCWWLLWSDANHLFAGYSDIRGMRSSDSGESWSFNLSGHDDNSMYHLIQPPINGILYGATSTVHDMYQSTYLTDARIDGGKGKIIFSLDQGATWQTLHDFGHPVIWLALDPNNLNRMYASVIHSGVGGIYVSSNIQNGAASTWTKLANPPRTAGHPFNIHVLNDGALVCTYSGRRDAAGAFTTSSGVFVSTDAGQSWQDRSDAGMVYWTKDLVIYPHDATQSTWYVGVFSGWGGAPNGLGGLYRSTNRGVNWQKISNHDRVSSIAFDPQRSQEAYLTTEQEGLWFSKNISAANPTFTPAASYPFRQPERVFFNPFKPNEIWVTSFGHGMRAGTRAGTSVASDALLPANFALRQNHPNPFNPATAIRYELQQAAFVRLRVYDLSGREVATLQSGPQTAGAHETLFTGEHLASGVYFYELTVGDFTMRRKMALVR